MAKNTKQNQTLSRNSSDSFLEAFRDLGSGVAKTAKNDLFKKGAQDIFSALSPFSPNPPKEEMPASPSDLWQKENELEQKYRSHFQRQETVQREVKVLFTREQRETQQHVNALQQEIKKLAKATSDLASEAKEAEMSAMQNTVEVGTYHLNFFDRLRKIIASLRSQIQESSMWLSSWNKKAQKKNYYWGQFKKSGSKFMLSSDRYMSTQAG